MTIGTLLAVLAGVGFAIAAILSVAHRRNVALVLAISGILLAIAVLIGVTAIQSVH